MTGDAHRGGDDERNQHQAGSQRDRLAAVEHPVLQRVRDDGGEHGQQQKCFLLEE
ncbi:hypothetical protein D3C84_1263370 [compost metagenome]